MFQEKISIYLSHFWRLDIIDMIHNTAKVQYNLCHGKSLNQGRGNKEERGSSNIHYTRNNIMACVCLIVLLFERVMVEIGNYDEIVHQ